MTKRHFSKMAFCCVFCAAIFAITVGISAGGLLGDSRLDMTGPILARPAGVRFGAMRPPDDTRGNEPTCRKQTVAKAIGQNRGLCGISQRHLSLPYILPSPNGIAKEAKLPSNRRQVAKECFFLSSRCLQAMHSTLSGFHRGSKFQNLYNKMSYWHRRCGDANRRQADP